jgi:hypothetical protein
LDTDLMNIDLMPFIWVAITLPILSLLGRWIHRHVHGLAILITSNRSWAVILYAMVLFPGVLLHELAPAAFPFYPRRVRKDLFNWGPSSITRRPASVQSERA